MSSIGVDLVPGDDLGPAHITLQPLLSESSCLTRLYINCSVSWQLSECRLNLHKQLTRWGGAWPGGNRLKILKAFTKRGAKHYQAKMLPLATQQEVVDACKNSTSVASFCGSTASLCCLQHQKAQLHCGDVARTVKTMILMITCSASRNTYT
jgi:hypothetical protein